MLELKGISPAVQEKINNMMEEERQIKKFFDIPDSHSKPLNDEEQFRLCSILIMAQKDDTFRLYLDMVTGIFVQVATEIGPHGLKAIGDGFAHTANFVLGKEGE